MASMAHSGWQRIVACVVAYALVLQAFAFAAAVGSQASAAADSAALAGFELCTHSGAGPALPDAPANTPAGDEHCPFCLAGAVYVNCAPPGAPQVSEAVFTDAIWPFTAPRLVGFLSNESARPRGPPAAV